MRRSPGEERRLRSYAELQMERMHALTVPCPWCTALIGEVCKNQETGEHHPAPAHYQRIGLADLCAELSITYQQS